MLDPWSLLLIGLPALPLGLTLFNLITWRRGDERHQDTGDLAILIPARNEESNIGACLESILQAEAAHGAPLASEIWVGDDHSTDGTAAVVQKYARRDSRFHLRATPDLPAGWVGKPHNCHDLLAQTAAEKVLFMDADVRLVPGGIQRLLSLLSAPAHARVVTAVPRQETGSWVERWIMPLLILTYTAWLPLRLVEVGRDPKTVAANGQLLLLRREDALALGGFENVRAEIVDDVAFCRHAKSSGYRVVFADGFEAARCRMYTSAKEVWRGFSKNLYEGLGENPLVLLFVLALHLCCFVAPYLFLVGALTLSGFASLAPAAAIGVGLNVLLRLSLAIRFRQPWEGIVFHPFAVLGLMAIAINSFLWVSSNRIEWAGRLYAAKSRRSTLANTGGGHE